MEPTTIKNNKTKIIGIIVIVLIIIIIAVMTSLGNKNNVPSNTIDQQSSTDTVTNGSGNTTQVVDGTQLTNDINSAITFDNEADLKEVDKSFQ